MEINREMIVALINQGFSIRGIARKWGVSRSRVDRIWLGKTSGQYMADWRARHPEWRARAREYYRRKRGVLTNIQI